MAKKPAKRQQRGQRRYSAVIRAVYETPWAIREEKLQAIRDFLARKTAGDVLSREEIQLALSGRARPMAIAPAEANKVALINVQGTISPRLSLMDEISGGCSAEDVGKAFDAAIADETVGTIVLNFDSPGGSVFGIQELGDKIYAGRGQKRIIGLANHEAASAAFWLLSQCDEIVVAPNGWVGSIGVLMMHYSTAGWEEKQGYQTTITRTPATKAEGAAGETLSKEALASRQEMVDGIYEKFAAAVARGRGVSVAKVKAGFGNGRMVMADDAKSEGMVDRIATLEQLLGELGVSAAPAISGKSTSGGASGCTSVPAFSFEGNDMNKKIFGALVRIGMCPITASTDEATAALDRFFAVQGVETPAAEAEQLAALEAYIKADGGKSKPKPKAEDIDIEMVAGKLMTLGGDERAEDITAAVRLSSLSADRKIELISELLAAKTDNGDPISMSTAVRRIQKEQSEKSKTAAPGATHITAGEAEKDKFMAAARDACLLATFGGNAPKQIFDAASGAQVDWKPERGNRSLASPLGLARQCLVVAGVPANRVMNLAPVHVAKLVMGGDPRQLGLGSFYASDGPGYNVSGMFSNILLDAANVSLRRSFDDARTTYQMWMKRGPDVPDFKLVNKVIAGELGDPKAVPEDGTFEETTLTDGKVTYRLTVWGEMVSHSWQLVVNDRLSSFMELPQKMGNAMKRKMNRLSYQRLKDNPTMPDTGALFNSTAITTAGGHNNLATGALTTAADYTTAWNGMSRRMREQRGIDATNSAALNISPRWVLFPPAIRGPILTALGSSAVTTSGNAGEINIWKGQMDPVEEAELGAAASGGSDTAHYTIADNADIDTHEYAFLEGLDAPVIEQENSFTSLAIKRRIYFAFAVSEIDYRGEQKHTGA
jgi:signal peptide peptidase SppA